MPWASKPGAGAGAGAAGIIETCPWPGGAPPHWPGLDLVSQRSNSPLKLHPLWSAGHTRARDWATATTTKHHPCILWNAGGSRFPRPGVQLLK
eukprot:12421281-Karenia_brevis.AAC.1